MRKYPILIACLVIGLSMLACQTTTVVPTQANTAVPLPTPTTEPPQDTGITLPFYDDFSVNQYGWPIDPAPGTYADTTYEISSGVYKWTVFAHKNAYSIAWPDLPALSDFTVTMDARQVSEKLDDSDYGFIYRTMDGQQYISFAVSNKLFSVYFYDKKDGWQELVGWTDSDAILPGQVNHLKLTVSNGQYVFFANEAELTSFSDDRITEGRPGIGVDVYNAGDTGVFEFDNFMVTSP